MDTHTAIAASLLAVHCCAADPEPTEPKCSILQRDRLTGDWFGSRAALEERGLTIGAEYIAEHTSVWSGGVSNRASFRNLLTIDATLDLEAAIGIDAGTFFVQYLHVTPERGGSGDAGDIQGFTNIENGFSIDAIYELWHEVTLLDDRVRIKAGKVDANSEFAFVDAAGEFAHSSAGFSPTVQAFPSYPDSATSINIFGTLMRSDAAEFTLGYGVYDGSAQAGVRTGTDGPASVGDNGFLHVAEAALAWAALSDPDRQWFQDGRFTAGAWIHTESFERFDGATEDQTAGVFLTFEQRLLERAGAEDGGLIVFAQYAWADDAVAEVGQHIGLGLVTRGTFPSRDADSAGVYLSFADLSDDPASPFSDDELAIDAYYRLQLTPAIFIQPEIQYIVNPSGDPSVDDAVVGGVRAGFVF